MYHNLWASPCWQDRID